MTRIPLTVAGAEKLREELKRLKSEDRPRVVAAIAEARAHGDLRENAEYHAAKEQQGFIEARIREIEGKLSMAEVIDVSRLKPDDKVVFGATVVVSDLDEESEYRYRIVGEDEADIRKGLISVGSPLARSLIGRREGDEIRVTAPGGDRVLEILEVRYE